MHHASRIPDLPSSPNGAVLGWSRAVKAQPMGQGESLAEMRIVHGQQEGLVTVRWTALSSPSRGDTLGDAGVFRWEAEPAGASTDKGPLPAAVGSDLSLKGPMRRSTHIQRWN